MTTLLVFWLAATVALAVLLGVIVLVQRIWPVRGPSAGRTARPAPGLYPQSQESQRAA